MARLLTRDEAERFAGVTGRTIRNWVNQRFMRAYYSEDQPRVVLYKDAELVHAKRKSEDRMRGAGWGRGNCKPDPSWPLLWDE